MFSVYVLKINIKAYCSSNCNTLLCLYCETVKLLDVLTANRRHTFHNRRIQKPSIFSLKAIFCAITQGIE
jgi:hypothetical protein